MTAATDAPALAAARMSRRRWLTLIVVCLGQLVILVDSSIVNVALAVIERSLHFNQATLAWVVNAYLVAFGGLLLLAGRLGDLFGRKRMFLFGLSLFTVASALCGLSDSATLLIAARFVQGVGAACSSAMVLGILAQLFPHHTERAKAMSVYAFFTTVGAPIGLVFGGVLIQLLNWHWIFFINLPIGILGVIAASILLVDDVGVGVRGGLDWTGGLLVVVAPLSFVTGAVRASSSGWTASSNLALFLLAVLSAALFFVVEGRVRRPLLPLAILRRRQPTAANVVRVFHGFGSSAVFFLGALYIEHVLRFSPIDTGFAFLALSGPIGLCSVLVMRRAIRRFGPRTPAIPGFLSVALGLFLLSMAPADGSYWTNVFPGFVILGMGSTCCFLCTVTIAMSRASGSETGVASGFANLSVQLGQAFGTAIVASVSASATAHALARHESQRQALASGYHVGYLVAVAAPLMGAFLMTVLFRGRNAVVMADPEAVESELALAAD